MDNLIIHRTEETPEIIFDIENGYFKIDGISITEDAETFYKPIFKWFDEFSNKEKTKLKAVFKVTYYNSSAAIQITKILKKIEELYKKGFQVEVEWHYNPDDDSLAEDGKEFSNFFSYKFTLIKIT